MLYLIIYAIGFLITFIALSVVVTLDNKEKNAMFMFDVFHPNYFKLLLASTIWPLTWVYVIVLLIFNR